MTHSESSPAVRNAMRRFELAIAERRTRDKLDIALDLLDRADSFERSEDRDKAVSLLIDNKRYRLASRLGLSTEVTQ